MTSDTATEVTDDMFDIMKSASRKDDVFGIDPSVNELEHHVAKLFGHEASLFCASGSMTNQLGLRTLLTQPPHSVLCDSRSHIYLYECGGLAYHSQAGLTPTLPKNELYLTAEDVQANIVTDDLCGALTKVIALENTLNGTVMPLDELQRIHTFARKQNIKLHLDGARIWNASQATGVALADYGQLFDTISVCVSKGVGAPIGSLVIGSSEIIRKARHLRKLMGGGWRQAGLLAKVAHHCIDTVVPTMPETHRLTKKLATKLEALGMRTLLPVDTNMVFLETAPLSIVELADALHEHNIVISRDEGSVTRLVLHHQIDAKAVDDFIRVASKLVQAKVDAKFSLPPSSKEAVDISKAYPTASVKL
ncbi:pyridoxal phosphate-dependent transferase [Zychaea mexicana]|uniref:pyridoxal phosphate-dependent transferase n=1 Tax=Zychaea mexicana TaxID=64656 RepID=UPI0022FDFB8A|nr:pyridoxal phosphate-dependent transferase [Zychaea mexicana]KAI9479568.1 pyridoxal phosphate-dependent transferase [Zychaea mexicana]